jgi:hypothetical protein
MTDYMTFYNPDIVFSLAFFIGFIGFGVWWSKDLWPWLKGYLDKAQSDSTSIRLAQLDNVKSLTEAVAKIGAELVSITELQRYILQKIEGVKWQD